MANKDKLGDFYSTNNELGINSTMSFGNSSVNVSINATSVVLSPSSSLSANGTIGTSGQVLTSNGTTVYWAAAAAGVNTSAQYTWTNTHVFQANVTANSLIINSWLSANGSNGTAGMVLTSAGGSNVYWSSAGVNTAAQYTWTNTHLFNANVTVNASFFATTKSFLIDHPTKPDMKLRYGSLEGPENGVYVRGVSESFIIKLPDYWTGLVHANSITVCLTAIGSPQNLFVSKIENNIVYVMNDNYTLPYFHYHIFAERKDVETLVVEY